MSAWTDLLMYSHERSEMKEKRAKKDLDDCKKAFENYKKRVELNQKLKPKDTNKYKRA